MVSGLDMAVNVYEVAVTDLERWHLVEFLEATVARTAAGTPVNKVCADVLGQFCGAPKARYQFAEVVA